MNPLQVAARHLCAFDRLAFSRRSGGEPHRTISCASGGQHSAPGAAVATGTANTVTDQAGLAAFRCRPAVTFRDAAGFRPSLAVFVGVGTTR
jgi:hypothetical protein